MEKTKQVGKVDPKPAIQTTGIESSIHQRIVTLDHHAALTSQAKHRRARIQTFVYRRRFITNATQPANSPPPTIVVPNERAAPAPLPGVAPSSNSRTPPCTISTERVSNAPIANHHLKDLTGVPETERHKPQRWHASATVTKGRYAVKKTIL